MEGYSSLRKGSAKMIILKLQGGLGNQLFQIAYADKISQFYNKEIFLHPEHSQSLGGDFRNEALSEIGINFLKKNVYSPNRKFLRRIFFTSKRSWNYVDKFNNRYYPDRNFFLDGFFQDSLCGMIYAKKLKSNPFFNGLARKPHNILGLHVRRGDYASNLLASRRHGVLPLEYYLKAKSYFTKDILRTDIFSDDPDYVKHTIMPHFKNVNLIETGTASADLIELSTYTNLILANSTFSWWAAVLSENEKRFIVAPRRWFTDGSCPEFVKSMKWTML